MKIRLILFLILLVQTGHTQISDFKTIDFTKADNIAKVNEGSSIENLPLLAHKLTYKLTTEVEKFRAIYTWVCKNIIGDSNQNNKVRIMRKKFKNDSIGYHAWNESYKRIAYRSLLNNKKTMCTGYAYLIKELCFIVNIECKIIDGYGRSFETNVNALEIANHSWNAVKLNNKWYLCDATWSSGYMINSNLFAQDYNEGYFLTDPILFAKNHYPIEQKWFLNQSLVTAEFIPEPIVYGETFKHKIIPVGPALLNTIIEKKQSITFKFKSLNTISNNDISLVQMSGKTDKILNIYDFKNEEGIISFKYKFNHRGLFDIHLKIKSDIVASYAIKVTKI